LPVSWHHCLKLGFPTWVVEKRKLARQLLDDLSTEEVELLVRLSLLSRSFRRDQAIKIGEIEPPVLHPGNCLDKLVGPWIEPSGENRFQLSTLFTRAAEENCSPDRIRPPHSSSVGQRPQLWGQLNDLQSNRFGLIFQCKLSSRMSLYSKQELCRTLVASGQTMPIFKQPSAFWMIILN